MDSGVVVRRGIGAVWSCALLAALWGCSGGGGGGGSDGGSTNVPVTPGSLTLTGVVAKGARSAQEQLHRFRLWHRGVVEAVTR